MFIQKGVQVFIIFNLRFVFKVKTNLMGFFENKFILKK